MQPNWLPHWSVVQELESLQWKSSAQQSPVGPLQQYPFAQYPDAHWSRPRHESPLTRFGWHTPDPQYEPGAQCPLSVHEDRQVLESRHEYPPAQELLVPP